MKSRDMVDTERLQKLTGLYHSASVDIELINLKLLSSTIDAVRIYSV
jgi:hypothetical protein